MQTFPPHLQVDRRQFLPWIHIRIILKLAIEERRVFAFLLLTAGESALDLCWQR
jgi:hypothetical protein